MRRICCFLLIFCLFCAALPGALAYETRGELRAAHRAVGASLDISPYAETPQVAAPYSAGVLSEYAANDALAYLNFLRSIAGLEPVSRSRIYDFQCQHGAALLGALDIADHNAPKPADMDQNFYDSAHLATTSSNIVKFNWMRPSILREGLAYFVRDDGDANLPVLGHRRWLLNPCMGQTGFGLANSRTGMSYVTMYAHDFGNMDVQWSEVLWPAAGAFPVELMHSNLAWSVTLNAAVYDVEHSNPQITLTEERLGLRFEFDCAGGTGDGFCTVNTGNYGGGPCIIFRPDFSDCDFTDYVQNQNWNVKITGLRRQNGESAAIEYEVQMTSLYVQEVANIEISYLEAQLKPGETLQLTADVIPAYADDLSVEWRSSDESIAAVTPDGLVTAKTAGTCEITVQSPNGRNDVCILTVSP